MLCRGKPARLLYVGRFGPKGRNLNLFSDIRALVTDCLGVLAAEGHMPGGLSYDAISVEPPRDAGHGDMSTNAAMMLAKPAGMSPRAIADMLVEKLRADARLSMAEVAGPGFINLRLAPVVWQGVVHAALTEPGFGRSTLGQGRRVNVEFVSAFNQRIADL